MDEEKKSSGFKVMDRRRVDEHGEDRAEAAPHSESGAASPVMESPQTPLEQEVADDSMTFGSFVMSLATQALMQLGQLKAPEGVDLPVNKAAARQTIDLIAMLEQKTKGNLDKDEQRLVEEILHTLRFQFVQSKGS
jgi:hypothetical protein